MKSKSLLGGILFVVGAAIGAGILVLPIVTAAGGFWFAMLLLFICGAFMLLSALTILEITVAQKGNSDLTSMAKKTLGRAGQVFTWFAYLIMLYSLICAYITGGADIIGNVANRLRPNSLTNTQAIFAFVIIFGSVFMIFKARKMDWINRFLMLAVVVSFFFLVLLLFPETHVSQLHIGQGTYLLSSVTLVIFAYNYHFIIPTLSAYYEYDVKKLRRILIGGTGIVFLVYTLWTYLVHTIVPVTGEGGLTMMTQLDAPLPRLSQALGEVLSASLIAKGFLWFSFFAILTSFLGASISISHFLYDGLSFRRTALHTLLVALLSFVPPVLFILYYPPGFILALTYGGLSVALVLCILPAWIAWKTRYKKHIPSDYRVAGGKLPLLILLLGSVAILGFEIAEGFNILPQPACVLEHNLYLVDPIGE